MIDPTMLRPFDASKVPALQEANAALLDENAALREKLETMQRAMDRSDNYKAFLALESRLAALTAALKKRGHDVKCRLRQPPPFGDKSGWVCDCEFDQLLRSDP